MAEENRRVALITGAAGGLGSAVAQLLASSGHDLALVDVREDALAVLVSDLAGSGARLETLPAELSNTSECERVVTETIARLGKVDILVNAAAILARRELEDVTASSFDEVFHINARAPFFLMRAVMPDMAKRNWGRIVNITSVGVYQGGEKMTSAPYEATKGAVSVFTKMFAKYGASQGILVNTVCPGAMKTRMILEGTPPDILQAIAEVTPLKRMAEPIEVARMIAWLCGDENSYATGATFDIVGGWVMP
ncbi:MAG: SDR family NAD(P)-dependent oxidoreductase [Chloroflexi bacterium]|nr:SDR family NAD(P)-dependent oxidoreductase [Chloroflexota bacterium]